MENLSIFEMRMSNGTKNIWNRAFYRLLQNKTLPNAKVTACHGAHIQIGFGGMVYCTLRLYTVRLYTCTLYTSPFQKKPLFTNLIR